MKTRAARQCFLLLLLAIFVFCGGKTTTVLAATSDLLANPDAAPLLTKRVLEEVRTAYQRLNEAALALRNELKANDPLHYQEQFAELVSRNNVALDTEYGEAAVTTVDNKFAIRVVHQASGGSFIFVRIPELTTHAEVAINERDAQDLDQSARDLAQIYPRQVLATPGPNQVQQIAQEIEASALGQKRSAHQKALQKDLLNERLPNLLDEAQSLEPAKSIGLRLLLARQHVDSNNLKGRHTVLVALTDVEISSGMASVEDVFKLQQGGNVKFYPNPRTSTRLPFYRKFALRIHDYWVATVVRPDMKDIQFGLISGITQFLVVTGIDLLHRMASGESFDLGAINYGPEIFTGIYGTVLGVYYQAYKTFLFRGYQSATKLFCKQWGSKLVFMVGMWALGYFDIRGGVIAAMWHIFANSYITIYFKNYLNTYPNFKRDLRESTYTLREWLQKEERHPLFKWFEEYSWARHLLEIKVSNYLYQSFYFSYFIPKMLDLKGGKSFVRMMMVAGIPSLQYFASYLPLRYKLRRSYLDFLQHPEYSAPEQETKTQNIAILKKSLYDSANSWWSTKKIALTAPVWLNNVITTPLYKMLLGPLAKFLYGQNERHELLDARVGAFLDEEFRQNRLAPRFHLLYEKRILDASVKAVIRRDLQAAALADDLKEILENFWQNKNLDPALQERLWQLVAPSFAQNWPQVKTLADFKRQFNIWFKDHAREALWQEVALRAPLEEAGQMDFATAQTFIDILHLVNLPSDVYQQVRQFWVSEAYTVPQVSGRLTKIISEVSQMHFALERTENLAAEDKKFLGQMVQDGYAPLAMPQAVQTYIQQLSKWRGLRWEKPPFREEAVASLLQLGALPRQGVIRRMAAVFPDVEAYFAHVAEDLPSIKEEWRRPVKNFGTKMVKQAAQIRATPRFKEFFGQWQMQVEQVCTLVPYSCKNTLFADRDFIGPVPEDAAPWAAEEQALAQAMQRPDCAAAGSPDCLKQVAAQLNSATVLDTVLATPLLASRSYVRAASVDQVNGQVVSSQDPWPVPPEKLRPATQVKVPDDRTLLAAAAPVSKVTSWWHHAARWAMGPHRANNRLKNISNDHTMQGFDQLMAGDVAEAMMQYDQKMWQGSEAAKMVSPELLAWLNHLARQNHLTAAEGGDFIAQAARQGKAVLAQALPWRLQQLVLDAWREEQDRLTEIHHALEQTKAQAKLSLAVQDFLFDLRQEGSVASGHTVLPILSEASLAALDAALEHGYLPAELPEDLRQAFSLERDNARLDAEVHAFLEDVHQQRYLSWEAVQAMDKIARPSLGQQQQLRKVLASLDADLRLVQQVAQHGAPVVQRLQEFAALDEIRLGGQSFTPEQTAFYEQQIKFLRHTVGLTPQALGPYTLGEKVAFILRALRLDEVAAQNLQILRDFGQQLIQEEAAGLSLAQRQQVAAIPVTTYEQTYKLKQLMLQRTPLPSYLPKAVHQVLERLAAEDSPLISPAALSYARQHYKAWNLWHPQRYAITPTLRQEIQALLNHTITLHPQRYGAVAGEIGYDFDPIVHQAAVRDLRFSYGQILVMQKVLAQIRFADFVEAVEAAEHGQKLQSTGLGQKLRDYEREHGLVLPHAAPEDADRTILDFWSAFDKRKFSRVELADLMKVAQQVLAAPLEKEEKNNYFLENMNLGYYRKTFTEPASHENFAQSAYDLPLELLYGVLSPNVLQRHTITTNTNAVNLAVPQHFYHVSSSAGEAAPAATCAQLLR